MTFRDLTGTLRLSNTTEHRQKGTCFLVETRVSVLTNAGIDRTRLRYGHKH